MAAPRGVELDCVGTASEKSYEDDIATKSSDRGMLLGGRKQVTTDAVENGLHGIQAQLTKVRTLLFQTLKRKTVLP